MARYAKLYQASEKLPILRQSMAETLLSCDLNLVYETADYLLAQEKPGQVPYTQLVTVEVLLNSIGGDEATPQISLVVRNDELLLKDNSHCQDMFDLVEEAIAETRLGTTA